MAKKLDSGAAADAKVALKEIKTIYREIRSIRRAIRSVERLSMMFMGAGGLLGATGATRRGAAGMAGMREITNAFAKGQMTLAGTKAKGQGVSAGFSVAQAMWITGLVLQLVTLAINLWEKAEAERIARREALMEARGLKTEAEFNRWENDQRRAIENAYRARNIP